MLQNLDRLRYSLQSAPTVLGGIVPAALPMAGSSAPGAAGLGADLFPNCCPPTGGPIKLVDGLRQDAITKAGRADWYPPQSSGGFGGLVVNNTLTGDKQPFVPRKGRRVTWYTCGPTVYDSSHMGHARAYVTFDILRRVMTQYFGYDVFYQLNVTDVDDKIILRARRNKLLADYVAAKPGAGSVKKDLDAILPKLREKAEGNVKAMEQVLPEGATGMERTERKEQLAIAIMKLNNFNGMEAKCQAAISAGVVDDIIAAGKDALQEKLDEELGSTVTDHEVFAAHARK
jgi:cysteinyl-tRNA synthetase